MSASSQDGVLGGALAVAGSVAGSVAAAVASIEATVATQAPVAIDPVGSSRGGIGSGVASDPVAVAISASSESLAVAGGPGAVASPSQSTVLAVVQPVSTLALQSHFVWTADMIIEQGARERPQQPWSRNNQAQKWFRWRDEEPVGVPRTGVTRIDLAEPCVMIGAIDHEPSNENFSFASPAVAGREEAWFWKQFLLALRPGDFKATVGLGIVGISAFATPGSYDHHRHHAQRKHDQTQIPAGVRAPIWDFKVTRADGSEVLLHPRWRGNKLSMVSYNPEVAQARADLFPPKMELGGTEGPGTFRRYAGYAHPEEMVAKHVEGIDPVRDAHRRRHLDGKRQGTAPPAAAAAAGSAVPPAPAAPPPARQQAGVPPPPPGPAPTQTVQVPGPPQGGAIPPMPKRAAPTLAGTPPAGAVAHAGAAAAADDTVWHRGQEYWQGANQQWWWKDPQSGKWHR